MLSKVEAIFIFAIVAGLAVLIWANIVSKGKVGQLTGQKSGCSCGGGNNATSAVQTVMTNPVDNL